MEDLATGLAWEEPGPRETTGTVLRLLVNTVAYGPTKQEKSARPQVKNVTTVENLGHFSKMCRHNPDYQNHEKTAIKHIDTEEQPADYIQSEYTTPYYVTNEQAKAAIKCLKTTTRVHHIQDKDTEHIRPL